jgi:hypothetical protein
MNTNEINNQLNDNEFIEEINQIDNQFEEIDLNDNSTAINHDIICSQREIFDCNECHNAKCLCQIIHYPTYGEICLNCKEQKGETIYQEQPKHQTFLKFP